MSDHVHTVTCSLPIPMSTLKMVFHWNFYDSKSPQVFRILLRILTDLNNPVIWMVITCPLISISSSACANLLVTVLRAPITIVITATFMFHSSFRFLARSLYLSSRFLLNILGGLQTQQSSQFSRLFFVVVDYPEVWSSGRN